MTRGILPWADYAIREIRERYGDRCDLKNKSLFQVGRNRDLGEARETLMALQGTETNETYLDINGITHVVSDNDTNTQEISVEGATISGSDFTAVTQMVTLNGQTPVALTTPLARTDNAANTNSTPLAASSKVYFYEGGAVTLGVPDTDSEIHLTILAEDNESSKAAIVVPSIDYLLLTRLQFAMNKKQDAEVDAFLEVRLNGAVFRTKDLGSLSTAGASFVEEFNPYFIIPPNADVRLAGSSSVAGPSVSGSMEGVFVTKTNI